MERFAVFALCRRRAPAVAVNPDFRHSDKGRLQHRGGPRPGQQPRDPAGREGHRRARARRVHDHVSDPTVSTVDDLAEIRDRVARHLVGRERELDLVLAAVGRRPGHRAGGAAGDQQDHDPAGDHRRVGHPAAVRRGQRRPHPGQAGRPPQPGPGAARGLQRGELRAGPAGGGDARGGFLYIEEFNRAPEDTLNTLLTAMAERQVAVPAGRARRRRSRRSG